MEAYKLLRVRADGTLGSLRMDAGRKLPPGEWLPAGNHARPGLAPHPGWHALTAPASKHFKMLPGRRWYRVELSSVTEYPRPGEMWLVAGCMRIIAPVESEQPDALCRNRQRSRIPADG